MPLSGIASYMPTMREFIAHWSALEANTNAPFCLGDGTDGSAFTAFAEEVREKIEAVAAPALALDAAARERDTAKGAFLPRLTQFNLTARATFAKTGYERNLPRVPGVAATEEQFLQACDEIETRWAKIDTLGNRVVVPTFTAPMVLPPDDYTLAGYRADYASLRMVFAPVAEAEAVFAQCVEERNTLLTLARDRMTEYRRLVRENIPKENPLFATVPAVAPVPSAVPAAPSVTGDWDLETDSAVITLASLDEKLTYEVRYCTGTTTFRAKDEMVVGSFAPGATTFSTVFGLAVPGSVALYRVYAMTADGIEKASGTLKITRGAAPINPDDDD